MVTTSVSLAVAITAGSTAALVCIAVLLAILVTVCLPAGGMRRDVLWWMNPSCALVLSILPGLLLCALVSDAFFVSSWQTPKFITFGHGLFMLALAGAFVLGGGVRIQRVASAIASCRA